MDRWYLFLAVLFSMGLASSVQAQNITFEEDELVVVASASPDSTFIGGDGNLSLTIDQSSGDFGGDGVSHALLRFNDFSLPPVAIINSASLNFQTVSATNGPVKIYPMVVDWNTTTTWNSLGGNGLTPGVETTLDATAELMDIVEEPTSFDVTTLVRDWVSGTVADFGFGIINESGDGWDIRTVDIAEELAPTLVVDVVIPAPLKLQVDPNSGFARFLAPEDAPSVQLNSYQILGSSGTFDHLAWETQNLSAQGRDADDPSSPGSRWDTVLSTSDALMEAYLLGGTDFVANDIIPIGRILDQPVPENGPFPDIDVTLGTSNFLGGADPTIAFDNVIVEFEPFGDADFDDDGDTDGADFLAWQRGESPTSFSPQDLDQWRTSYGTANGQAAISAASLVPEPQSIVLLCMSLLTVCARRN